jgi:hypothetical protein
VERVSVVHALLMYARTAEMRAGDSESSPRALVDSSSAAAIVAASSRRVRPLARGGEIVLAGRLWRDGGVSGP